jgi:hypothetical protein
VLDIAHLSPLLLLDRSGLTAACPSLCSLILRAGFRPSHKRRIDVVNVRNILIVLICVTPLILLWDKLIVQGLLAGLVAVALAITALTLRLGETTFLVLVSRALFVAAAIPVLWITLQILPLHLLAHPIWRSAETAFQHPIAGSISVDPGASIIALGNYLTIAAVAFVSAAVAVDRLRATWILFALSAATSVIAVLLIINDLFFPDGRLAGTPHEQAIDCAGLGTIIAGAACIRSVERYETRRSARRSKVTLMQRLIIFGAAFVICGVALALAASKQAIFATVFGIGTLACIVIIRRFGLGLFGIGGMALLAIGIAIIVMAVQPTKRGTSVALAFASESSSAPPLSQRMLDDSPLVGTGAGTFGALAPIYREMGDPQSDAVASTAAGTLAIELGSPMLWLITAAAVAGIVVLLRASLQRGRDSFYPAMAGAASITLLLLAFTNAGLLGNATGLIAAAAVGLGFAQSKSRSAQA